MTMQKKLILTSLLAMSFSSFATDYSKCSQFLGGPNSSMGGSPLAGISYVPFNLNENGSLDIHDSVISHSTNDETKTTEIVYQVPDYAEMYARTTAEAGSNGLINGGWNVDPVMRNARMIVRRNEAGDISEIISDQNYTQSELDQMMVRLNTQYEASTTEEQRNQNKEMAQRFGQDEFRLPFFTPSQTSITFEARNGECTPISISNTALTEPKRDGSTSTVTNHNIPLCRDIHEFFEENPEAKSCFKAQPNRGIEQIFANYSHIDSDPGDGFNMGFGPGYYGGGYNSFMGGGFSGMNFMGVRQQMLMSSFFGAEHFREEYYNRMGNSPVLNASRILQSCIDLNLGSTISSDSIWAEPTPAPAQSEDSATAVPESE